MSLNETQAVPFITIYIDKDTFAKIYKKECFILDFQPTVDVIEKNEFVRIKTKFCEEWFGDFKITKIVMKNNTWQVFLGEMQTFYAYGKKDIRWFQKEYKIDDNNKGRGWGGVRIKKQNDNDK
jgi:hypothetical protein